MMKIDAALCIGCGQCVDICTVKHLVLADREVQETAAKCLNCGHCMAICPTKAIVLEGTSYDDVTEYSADKMNVETENLMHLLEYKRSMRNYLPKPVEPEKLQQILRAMQYSPTIGNGRRMRCIVLDAKKDEYALKALNILVEAKKAGNPVAGLFTVEALTRRLESFLQGDDQLFFHAPIVLLLVDEYSATQSGANAYIAASRMELVAESLGLGSCYIGLFTRAVGIDAGLQNALGIQEDEKVYAALTIGYPAVEYLRTVPRPEVKVEWM